MGGWCCYARTERLRKINALMESRGLDAVLLTKPQNVFYMAGYRKLTQSSLQLRMTPHLAAHVHPTIEGGDSLAVVAAGCVALIVSEVEADSIGSYVRYFVKDIRTYRDPKERLELADKAISDLTSTHGRVGTDSLGFNRIGRPLIEAESMLSSLRMQKSSEEVDAIRHASELADAAVETIMRSITQRIAIEEAAGCIVKELKKHDDARLSITTYSNRGVAIFDVSAEYQGYWTIVSRSILEPQNAPTQLSETIRKFNTTVKNHRGILNALKPRFKLSMVQPKAAVSPRDDRVSIEDQSATLCGVGIDAEEPPMSWLNG
ncbi:MAG: aminopeptidase P family N-terminal domain-containing protein, partial [Candidatus Bathyarchaeia archaeon]